MYRDQRGALAGPEKAGAVEAMHHGHGDVHQDFDRIAEQVEME